MPFNEKTFKMIEQNMISVLAGSEDEVVESSFEDLVTLVMNTNYQVQFVHLNGLDLAKEDIQRLEEGLVSAFNEATEELARRLGERFSQIVEEAQQ